MNVLVWLIPASLSLGALGLAGFVWTLRQGQYDDLDGAAWRLLIDQDDLDQGPLAPRSAKTPHDEL
ncbi:cbb3-type cytochrome oxidase assembly protein CcoS [Sulfitobacter sabulilitoris]|uniref:Cbb3-type cytochrome oxidase assembly protein CcoS n=1 Tax=Sulfitobacter sabulilitoris TaxID=2562655 RepID=A0A5S3PD30_9RHOB|nr:cbb3-type cytochrome oxidase assembly protein CcoS [Sulfitobacter sabulilitoris]TMM51774.1 cbb3-type cytochrome oxidase assembly protein CcoS [Sulfitobacter sabulilitoris]